MTSTGLVWQNKKSLEAWLAHLLPQTGHALGVKCCMTGMHGLNNLLTIFAETLVLTFFSEMHTTQHPKTNTEKSESIQRTR